MDTLKFVCCEWCEMTDHDWACQILTTAIDHFLFTILDWVLTNWKIFCVGYTCQLKDPNDFVPKNLQRFAKKKYRSKKFEKCESKKKVFKYPNIGYIRMTVFGYKIVIF
jgi:hypothetical protein